MSSNVTRVGKAGQQPWVLTPRGARIPSRVFTPAGAALSPQQYIWWIEVKWNGALPLGFLSQLV